MANAERLGVSLRYSIYNLSIPAFSFLLTLSLLPGVSFAEVKATVVQGQVQSRSADTVLWSQVRTDRVVKPGEEVKTSGKSQVTLTYEDGSKVEVGPKSSFVLQDAGPDSATLQMNLGKMKAWVSKVMSRRFRVRTPTAVCSVRGTEFQVAVAASGNTTVDLFKGSLGVADNKGNEALLQEGQRVDVSQQGLGSPQSIEKAEAESRDRSRQTLKREVGLEMSKEEVQAAAALEAKNAIYQEGKAMVDVNGNRVRIEDYIVRPRADQFKLVVLNERVDRFDYFYYLGTFNKALPQDISGALRQIPGCVDAACEYWLTRYETARSNTIDNMLENAWDGHLVNVNNNGVTGDEVNYAFDGSQNDFVDLGVTVGVDNAGNRPFWTTLYDNYTLSFNGINHHSWTPGVAAYNPAAGGCVGGVGPLCGGIQSMGDSLGAGDQRTVVDVTSLLSPPNCDDLDLCTGTREPGQFHEIQYLKNGAGTIWEKFDNYVIDDEGKVAKHSDFAGITSGAGYKATLLKWNFQQVITASEFGGRKIDLVFEPKILVQSGLIQ